MEISNSDRAIIQSMRSFGVLQDLNVSALDNRGMIILTCGDGDHTYWILHHLRLLYKKMGNNHPCLHLLSLNGLGIRLVRGTPVNEPNSTIRKDMYREIRGSHRIKKLNRAGIFIHAACGMATSYDLNFAEQMALAFEAKERLETELTDISVRAAVMPFVNFDLSHRRHYFADRARYKEWVALFGDSFK